MIPLFRPSCTQAEIDAVTGVLRSGWWGMGPRTEQFENRFAAYTGAGHAVAVSSCSAALQLTLEAAGLRGGEVIVPALTFASTALAALHAGNRVTFADIDEHTLALDWDDVAARQTRDTVAVIPVWYGGAVGKVPPVPLPVIEDCAHAAGHPQAGRQGLAACWSFHAVKNLAAGDGGMVTTADPDLARQVRTLRWCGIDKSTWERDRTRYGWEYDITAAGHKAHMNDITAALALAQLTRLDHLNAARRRLASRYLTGLAGLDWLRLPPGDDPDCPWHLFAVRVPAPDRDRFVSHLLAAGVSAGVHYKPLSHYTVFGPRQDLPVTERVWQTLVTLPLFPDMTDAEQAQVTAAVRGFT